MRGLGLVLERSLEALDECLHEDFLYGVAASANLSAKAFSQVRERFG